MMKVLIVIDHSPKQRFLVSLNTARLAKEVRRLVNKKMNERAIMMALSRGNFERRVEHHELPSVEADMILSERNVSWTL